MNVGLQLLLVTGAGALRAGVAPALMQARAPLITRAQPLPVMQHSSSAAAQPPPLHNVVQEEAPLASASATSQPRARRALVRTLSAVSLSLLLPAIAFASGAPGEKLHLGEKVALWLQGFGLPDWMVLVLISATPAIELRGGVPVGNWMGISPALTFLICVVGNMAPIAPMLLALRSSFFKKIAAPLLKRAEKKLAGLPAGQSRTLALALFVGVPAPGTGAWTGAIIAYLLDMPFGTAMASIFSGVLLAGGIMTTLTLAGKVGALVALAVLVAGGIGAIASAAKKEGGDEPTAA